MIGRFRHIDDRIADFCDERSEVDRASGERHLAQCARCRSAVEDFLAARRQLEQLPLVAAPDSLWPSIERAISAASPAPRRVMFSPALGYAAAALVLAAVVTGALLLRTGATSSQWRASVAPNTTRAVSAGERFETGPGDQLRLFVGDIGTVDLEPGSRAQVVRASKTEHRLSLERGGISAVIAAPPRIFFVNTPSSTVVDLGCAYTMRVDEAGGGVLRVTAGWASLEWGGRESLVPAGASCQTRPGAGPDTPAFDDASPALKEALSQFDLDNSDEAALNGVLTAARARDTLTLWHLLARVPPERRERVLDRMTALTPLPRNVDRNEVLRLERGALQRLREELAWTW